MFNYFWATKNKLDSRRYFIDNVEYRNLRLFCRELNISERNFYESYNKNICKNEFLVDGKSAVVLKLYNVETIE